MRSIGPVTLIATSIPCTVVSQIDIENRVDPVRIEERDGALIDGVLRAEEDDFALRDDDAAEHAGMVGRAAKSDVGVELEILRESGAELDVGRGLNLDVEAHPPAGRCSRSRRTAAWRPA